MPARSRPKKAERIRGRTNGRGGAEFDVEKAAGRRSVPMPTGKSENRMKLVTVKRAVQWVGALRFYRRGGASRKGAA